MADPLPPAIPPAGTPPGIQPPTGFPPANPPSYQPVALPGANSGAAPHGSFPPAGQYPYGDAAYPQAQYQQAQYQQPQAGFAQPGEYHQAAQYGPPSNARMLQAEPGLPTASRRRRRRRRVWPRVIGAIVGVAFLIGAIFIGLAVADGVRAVGAINRLVTTTSQLETVVTTNPEAAIALVPEIQADIGIIASALDGPVWGLAAHLPVIGDDVAAVRTVAATVNGLVQHGLPEMLDAVIVLQPDNLVVLVFAGQWGVIGDALNEIAVGDAAIAEAIVELEAIDQTRLMPRLAEPIGQLVDGLVQVRRATALVAAAANLVGAFTG